MLMAGKKKKIGRKPVLSRFSAPLWLQPGYQAPTARGWGFAAPGAMERFTSKDWENCPGVLALKLTNVKAVVIGNERMVQGVDPDGFTVNISESEATGEVEILSWHEIYEVRAPKVREQWPESRFRLEEFGNSSFSSRPNPIPETTVLRNHKKRLSAD